MFHILHLERDRQAELPPVPVEPRQPRGALKPIVKWAGGKSRLVPELVARMPAAYGRYYEPFLGGAALYLHCEPEHAVLGDTHPDLMNLYRQVGHAPREVVREVGRLAARHSREQYDSIRARWNLSSSREGPGWAAAFAYLNKTCFNGLWRVNSRGHFNVPMGRYANPRILDEGALRASSPAFKRAVCRTTSFEATVADARAGDFVYFDPPYVPRTPTSNFTAYTLAGFGETRHRELAALARRLAENGVHVMMSNSDTPLVHELYSGFRIDKVQRPGAMNSDPSKRHPVSELIITSGYLRCPGLL